MASKEKSRLKNHISIVKESALAYSEQKQTEKYKDEIYTRIKIQDLILFGIYSVTSNGETCTFERIVAECFLNFPKIFGFKRYPNWPDSLKFDRVLRTLREKGLIIGGAGGKYSPGEILLTDFGEKIAMEIDSILSNKKSMIAQKQGKIVARSIDDKLIEYLKDNISVKKFLNNQDGFSISEPEFRNILRCTQETPSRIVKQNLEYFKNLARYYKEKKLLDFLSFCENKFIKGRIISG